MGIAAFLCRKRRNPEVLLNRCFRFCGAALSLCGTVFASYLRTRHDRLALDSGLTTHRNNRSTPRDSILPLTRSLFVSIGNWLSTVAVSVLQCAVSVAQRSCICPRTCRVFLRLRVGITSCRLSRSLKTCQRTRLFLLQPRRKSIKNSQLYLACFQSSAAHPQALARILCNLEIHFQPATLHARFSRL